MASIASIFAKGTTSQRHYVKILPKSVNNCGKYGYSFIYGFSKYVTYPIFTKLALGWELIVSNSCTEFLANLTHGLMADGQSQTDGRILHIGRSFLCLVRPHWNLIANWIETHFEIHFAIEKIYLCSLNYTIAVSASNSGRDPHLPR
jgi:hypothetical protein